jgi:pyruvate formate lyase activating enzyme
MLRLKELLANNTMPSAPELVVAEVNGVVRCLACGHRCPIQEGRSGVCRVRFNEGGELRAPAGYVAGVQVDPIEKKPFFHAYPGRDALSFGMLGCDLHCSYCQNWVTSQALRDDQAVAVPKFVEPQRLVDRALEYQVPVMVSTYNEPLITADWAVKVFELAKPAGITCGFISNGNGTPEVLTYLRPWVDLYKVDLKGFDDRKYRSLGGVLKNVLDTIAQLKDMGFWVEIVTLLIPQFNDSDEELTGMAEFLAGISRDIPWHVTAYHPDYKMADPPATPATTLIRACDIGRAAGLRFVYAGNLPGRVNEHEHTCCPECGAMIIERRGFNVLRNRMTHPGVCPDCRAAIPGVWEFSPPKQSVGTGIPLPVMIDRG